VAQVAKQEKVAGLFTAGSAIASIYKLLEKGKAVTYASLEKQFSDGANVRNRLSAIHKLGIQAKKFQLERDTDGVKLVKYDGKVAVRTKAKPTAKPTPKAKSTTKPAPKVPSKAKPKAKPTKKAKTAAPKAAAASSAPAPRVEEILED